MHCTQYTLRGVHLTLKRAQCEALLPPVGPGLWSRGHGHNGQTRPQVSDTALHFTALHCTALHYTVSYCTVLYSNYIVLINSSPLARYSITLYNMVIHHFALHGNSSLYIARNFITMHCIILHHSAFYGTSTLSITRFCTSLCRVEGEERGAAGLNYLSIQHLQMGFQVESNRSRHLGIHKQTNACWSILRSHASFTQFKICRKWEL